MHDVKVHVFTGNGSQHGAAEENPTYKTVTRRQLTGEKRKGTKAHVGNSFTELDKMSLIRLKEEERPTDLPSRVFRTNRRRFNRRNSL